MTPSIGAKPVGAEDETSAAQAVRQMFNSIAPRYDLLNHLLSANIDRLWWRRTASRFRAILEDGDTAILDICCGTGDMTMALLKHRPNNARPILAADFARAMLDRGRHKFLGRAMVALEADALHLPVRSESLDLVVTAFGFRNLANYEGGLREFYRVLKPGGQLGILDFSEPGGLVGKAYALYFRHVLPAVGGLVSGLGPGDNRSPYNYLPASVGNFPPPPAMLALMRTAGYEGCAWQPYTFSIAGLYTAQRPLVV
jgi:demethylmenaquinone methyltransferase/2-methoxy-6-polyprenyl-1,4-benzoquinol methylase